jgi:hypothetical protein
MDMRVISFRGMDINGKWHYGLLAESAGFPKQPEEGLYISNAAGFPWAFQVRKETVGQCAGIRDKNGKWIYEGDIVNVVVQTEIDSLFHFKEPVVWNDQFACFDLPGSSTHGIGFGALSDKYTKSEIIGNIYEEVRG